MKNMIKYILLSLIIIGCATNEFDPINIFDNEELNESDCRKFIVGDDEYNLYVNNDRIEATDDGIHIKGAIFSDAGNTNVLMTSGDFILSYDKTDDFPNSPIIKGYGTREFPMTGFLDMFHSTEKSGGDVEFNTGKHFKSIPEYSDYLLTENKYYFWHKVDKRENTGKRDKKKFIIGMCELKAYEFFTSPYNTEIIMKGDFRRGTELDDESKRIKVEDMKIGLSAAGDYEFFPYQYTNSLVNAVEDYEFRGFKTFIYFAGDIPLRKYPLKINGKAWFYPRLNSNNQMDLFENGLEEGDYSVGIKGDLSFDRSLISTIPDDMIIALERATVSVDYKRDSSNINIAGEFKDKNYMSRIFGEESLKHFVEKSETGRMYCNVGEDFNENRLYIESTFSMYIPGMGNTIVREGVVSISPKGKEITGKIDMPYSMGVVRVKGSLSDNGDFELKGNSFGSFKVGNNMRYASDLYLTITQQGVAIKGYLTMPHDIGDIDVDGGIKNDGGFELKAKKSSNIKVNSSFTVPGELNFEIINNSIKLDGSLLLPCGIDKTDVEGAIVYDGIVFSGKVRAPLSFKNVSTSINMELQIDSRHRSELFGEVEFASVLDRVSNIRCGLFSNNITVLGYTSESIVLGGDVNVNAKNMRLSGSYSEGVFLDGIIEMPHGLGNAFVSGSITDDENLHLSGKLKDKIHVVGVAELNNNITVMADAEEIQLSGDVDMLTFGNMPVSGSVEKNSYSLSGNKDLKAQSFGRVVLDVSAKTIISPGKIVVSGNASGNYSVGSDRYVVDKPLAISPNWGRGEMGVCTNIPYYGKVCY